MGLNVSNKYEIPSQTDTLAAVIMCSSVKTKHKSKGLDPPDISVNKFIALLIS